MNDRQHDANSCSPSNLQVLERHRGELAASLSKHLRQSIFESRAFVRPSDVTRIADQQTDAFFAYLSTYNILDASSFGKDLGELGVGNYVVLAYGSILRRFLKDRLDLETSEFCWQITEEFYHAVIAGYYSAKEQTILNEQERIRWALQQSLHRYTVQLETAAEVARVAISNLDLATLLSAVIDLICERLNLDYVAAYLVDDENEYLELSDASCGEAARSLTTGRRLRIDGRSSVARCLTSHENIITAFRDSRSDTLDSSWSEQTQSEICLPLVTHGRVIGVLSAQSIRSDEFSSQDVTGFQIMADQLANAIENANLYADARQRADDLAAAYEQLKELEQLKDQFMQNISHELRTPLTMIHGYAELMASNQLGNLDAEQLDAVDVILRYSNALTVLVNDIMAIMEINTAKMANQSVSLAEMLSTSLLDFQVLAAGEGVHLASDIDENDLQPVIYANPDHLRRIVENLIGNAIKFTPAGGMVQVQLDTHDDLAVIQVS
ncbi:MAG: GAF domain-containing protein, partial [Anaerolineae bacterium]|nr:GAF domain-containing protein [Anaerolineae bacterium]